MPRRSAVLLSILVLSVPPLIGGCANMSGEEIDRQTEVVDRPEFLGRTRPDYEGQGTIEQAVSGDSDDAESVSASQLEPMRQRLASLDQRLARLEQQVFELARESQPRGDQGTTEGTAPVAEGYSTRIGLHLAGGVALPAEQRQALVTAIGDAAQAAGTAMVDPQAVGERLDEAGCERVTAPGCLGELAVYPGVRMVVAIESVQTTGSAAVITYRLHDTALDTSYNPRTTRLPVGADGELPAQALEAMADDVVMTARARADKAPWHTYAFSREGEQLYLSAGSASGLNQGDRLTVHAPGRTISTPGGNVAGWVPGNAKGTVEVTGFAGSDLAVARVVDGEAPTPRDPLVPVADGQ